MKNLLFILLFFFVSCSTPIEKVLEQNTKLEGEWIDSKTRFDSAYLDKNKNRFIYSYSIKNHETYSTEKIDFQDKIFERLMENNLKENVNLSSVEFKIIHECNLDLEFKYYSLNHRENIANVFFKRKNKSFDFERPQSEWNEAVDLFFEKLMKK
tara:strand:+ start:3927 stop:4388 length:462 start_codon:yes stop_codon:yes gene_type:complete